MYSYSPGAEKARKPETLCRYVLSSLPLPPFLRYDTTSPLARFIILASHLSWSSDFTSFRSFQPCRFGTHSCFLPSWGCCMYDGDDVGTGAHLPPPRRRPGSSRLAAPPGRTAPLVTPPNYPCTHARTHPPHPHPHPPACVGARGQLVCPRAHIYGGCRFRCGLPGHRVSLPLLLPPPPPGAGLSSTTTSPSSSRTYLPLRAWRRTPAIRPLLAIRRHTL